MADAICTIPYKGRDYELNPRDITVVALREFKQKFGPEYGRYISFINLFLNGDADAVACAIYLVLKKSGQGRPIDAIDFSPFDIFESIQKANDAKAEAEEAARANDEFIEDPTPSSGVETILDGTLT